MVTCAQSEGFAPRSLRKRAMIRKPRGDLAAGDALVRAAGGSVTTLEGAPVRYNQWDSLKAPKFVAAGDSEINYLERIPDPDL